MTTAVIDSRFSIYLFPVAFLLNASSMTVLLIGVGALGNPEVAADIAIVQGATLAVFYAFSANARSIILGESTKVPWPLIFRSRMVLLLPLGGATLALSVYLTGAAPVLALALILRRCSEWIAEINLALMERDGRSGSALWFIVIQSILLIVAMLSAVVDFEYAVGGLFLWALAPVMVSGHFLRKHFRAGSFRDPGWIHMVPHFGSTAITGVTVFVFRLVILLIAGKAYAGNLFTAFALGGILGSVFAQALGPTLVFHAREGSVSDIPGWLKGCLLTSAGLGLALIILSAIDSGLLEQSAKPAMFWSATGASLIGGAVMVFAQRFRLRLLQHHEEGYIFGPDVLSNIFMVACVPYVYYLLGGDALSYLFLLNAVIALVFYASAERTTVHSGKFTIASSAALRVLVAAGILLPVFFQLKGNIFSDRVPPLWDSGGDLLKLPVPISVLICYGAIVLLGRYERARESLYAIFFCFCLMLLSTVLSTHEELNQQQAKIILLIQLILPMLALVLGQIFERTPDVDTGIARGFVLIMAVIIPLQLVATWFQNLPYLASYVYAFTVYQHLEYVPIVLIGVYVFACFSLWQNEMHRIILLALAAPVGAYATLSLSGLAMGTLLVGAIVFVVHRALHQFARSRGALIGLMAMLLGGMYAGLTLMGANLAESGEERTYQELLGVAQAHRDVSAEDIQGSSGQTGTAATMIDRTEIWRYYLSEIGSGVERLMIGHGRPPDRGQYPSAHNFYLDFIYNFGLLALIPIVWLIGFTFWKSVRHRKQIERDPELFGLAILVLFLVLVDNSLEVGMRQPYSGIVTYFLWGVLLSRLTLLGQSTPQRVSKARILPSNGAG